MRVYCVSYDLRKPGQDYRGLLKELQSSPLWWHYLKSTWLIKTDESPQQLWDRISSHVDRNDLILIIEVRANHQGWLTQDAWKWINENVEAGAYYS